MRKTHAIKIFFLALISLSIVAAGKYMIFSHNDPVYAVTEEELKQQIAELETKVADLQNQSKTLSTQINYMNSQMQLTTLKIAQTEEEIVALTSKIGRLEVSLDFLAQIVGKRISATYKKGEADPFELFFSSKDFSDFVTRYKYLKVVQIHDKKLLLSMEETRTNYDDQKTEVEKLKARLDAQKKLLDRQKKEKESLLEITRGDEKRYQQLLKDAREQLAAIRRFVASQGGATILNNQTKCDAWGCYYNQRDSLWGNIGLGGSQDSVAEYGCLVSSVSMMASHNKKNIKPIDIAIIPDAFVLGTGYLRHSFSVNGVSVSITPVTQNRIAVLDAELSAGRPVIAGLYSGPDHFIVILRKEGNNYIMHDPFLENGANRPLTDKYSVSNISSLRLVQFN